MNTIFAKNILRNDIGKMTLEFLRMMLSLIYQQMKLVVAAGKFGQK